MVAPNIKNVQNLNVFEIQNEIKHLVDKSNKGLLTKQDLQGGNAALSNVGTLAGRYSNPINLPGQAIIVGIGRKTQEYVLDKHGKVREREFLRMSFGCDHRVLDGASVARFCLSWEKLMQPEQMIAYLR